MNKTVFNSAYFIFSEGDGFRSAFRMLYNRHILIFKDDSLLRNKGKTSEIINVFPVRSIIINSYKCEVQIFIRNEQSFGIQPETISRTWYRILIVLVVEFGN